MTIWLPVIYKNLDLVSVNFRKSNFFSQNLTDFVNYNKSNHKCSIEYISAFNFTHEIGQTRTKKIEINLNNIEFERAVLSIVSIDRKKLSSHLRNLCSKRRNRNHPILFGCPVPVKKNLHKKVRQKSSLPVFIPSRFSYKQSLIS